MQSKAADVEAYIEEAPAERREALTRLRQSCVDSLSGYSETMQYGMPCYAKDGKTEVAFASQKNYIALYCLKESIVRDHPELLVGLNHGKGCIRFSSPKKIDFEVVTSLLRLAYESNEQAC